MSEPRTTEITVETPTTQEWTEEMVAQWNALAETVTRAVQQSRKREGETGLREGAAHEQELKRMRAALAASEQRMAAATQESAERLQSMRRHYDLKLASLERELERARHPAARGDAPVNGQPGRTAAAANAADVVDYEEGEWEDPAAEEEWPPSWSERLGAQWARLRAESLFVPIAAGLAAIVLMVVVYSLLRSPVNAANTTAGSGVPESARRVAPYSPAASPASALPAVDPAPVLESSAATTTAKPDAGSPDTISAAASTGGFASNAYAVLLAGGKTLTATRPGESSAEYEARLAVHAGYTRTAVYQKNGRYMAVVLFNSQDAAREGIKAINDPYSGRWKKTSSVVAVEQWCPNKKALDPVVINGTDVAVWSCGQGPG